MARRPQWEVDHHGKWSRGLGTFSIIGISPQSLDVAGSDGNVYVDEMTAERHQRGIPHF